MGRIGWLARAVLVLGLAAGCGQTKAKESQAEVWIAVLNETADVMAGVKDEASARAAAPKLKELFQRERDLQAKVNAPGTRSLEEDQALKAYTPRVEAARARRTEELKRVSAMPGVRDILKDSLVGK